ncbi:MAG TPA: universal stress protein UspA, partial [Nitrospiria bacterium]|nr:universal stress protein UspA [Nitrospiria bacterium]
KSAIEAMKNLGRTLEEKGIDRNTMTATDEVVEDLLGKGMSGMVAQVADTSPETKPMNYYICSGCGHTAKGTEPVRCPICSAGASAFNLMDRTIFEAAAKTEGEVTTDISYDDVPIQWTDEARKLLRTVPPGFQRRRAKAKVEKTARKKGLLTITKEYAFPLLESEGAVVEDSGMGRIKIGDFTWTADAVQRLERVPEGFMRDCTRSLVEQRARAVSATTITLEIANTGIEEGKRTMEEAVRDPQKLNTILAQFKAVKSAEGKNTP